MLSGGSGKLHRALKGLRIGWDEANSKWRDRVSAEFEENHLKEIQDHTAATLREIDNLAEVLSQAQRECR